MVSQRKPPKKTAGEEKSRHENEERGDEEKGSKEMKGETRGHGMRRRQVREQRNNEAH